MWSDRHQAASARSGDPGGSPATLPRMSTDDRLTAEAPSPRSSCFPHPEIGDASAVPSATAVTSRLTRDSPQ